MVNNCVWLTGSRGFIGSYVKKKLVKSGYNVKCLTNNGADDEDLIQLDFSKRNQISNALKKTGVPKIVIHMGWGNTDNPHHDNHITLNVDNSINLIDEIYSAGVQKIIFMGTSSEYGELSGLLKEDTIFPKKMNNYIEGKRMVGKFGLDVAKKLNRDFINIRLFYTYGAGQKDNSLINQIYNCSLGNENMNLSPCEHYRDYIHVSDVAKGVENFFEVNGTHTVNLGSGTVIKLKNFVEKLWISLGAEPERLIFGAHEQPATEQSQPKAIADLSKLKKLTNWLPEISIEDGIRITVNDLCNK
jgi:nucleoside-diphosphate-sugar epimerase